ncbi:MAG: beta-propeller domain-containing protein [Methylococcaceae bacterium]
MYMPKLYLHTVLIGFMMAAASIIMPVDGLAASRHGSLKPKPVKSLQQLKNMVKNKGGYGYYGVLKGGVVPALADSGVAMAATAPVGNTPEQVDYSTTNVQVEGVDEADTVKTDGHYIYSLNNNQLRIIEAYPARKLALLATIPYDSDFSPIELFNEGDHLVVIGQSWRTLDDASPTAASGLKLAYWYFRGESQTVARVYDVKDKTQPKLEREIAFDGSYLSSRRIGNTVYLLGRKYPLYYPYIMPFIAEAADDSLAPVATAADTPAVKANKTAEPQLTRSQVVPKIRDSRTNNGKDTYLLMKQIYYFPDFAEANYIMVGSFNLDKPDQPVDVKSYLGGGDIVYASTENLYISAADYNGDGANTVTHIYKFGLKDGSLAFSNAGEVPGTPLNQYSLDENNGYFRIATTVNTWTTDGTNWQNNTWNNLYTLDDTMQVKGKLEHLAEGERIYSARFMGNKAYLVTYEQVDPLFVIDLSTPEEPKMLGQLKIPGFSNYLHPYDENHLLGLGQETVASTTGGLPTMKGVKLALFDVTDPTHPEELHSLVIGGKGSYSPASYDAKAFWFDKKRNLLGFPIEETDSSRDYASDEWPARVFQGAQVFNVTIEDGFVKKGAVTHLDEKPTDYDWYHYVQRLLTIGEQLYTFSDSRLKVNSLKDFSLSGQLDFPLDLPTDTGLIAY